MTKEEKIAKEADYNMVEGVFLEVGQIIVETIMMLFKFARTRKKSQETFDKTMSDAASAFNQLNRRSKTDFIMAFFWFAHKEAARKRKKANFKTIKLGGLTCLEVPDPKDPAKYVRAIFNRDVILAEPPLIHREASREAVALYTAEGFQHMQRMSHNVLEGMLQMLLKFTESRKRVHSKNFLDIELYKAVVAYKQVCRDKQSKYIMDFTMYMHDLMIKDMIKQGKPVSKVGDMTVPGKVDIDEIFNRLEQEHLAKQPLPKFVTQVVPNINPVNPMTINPKLEEMK